MKYAADFETTTDPNDCRVWAYALAKIDDPESVEYGTQLDHFMAFCSRKKDNPIIYFHNLKFDGMFILDWLFRLGFTWKKEKKELTSMTFTTLITDNGKFYEIIVFFYKNGHNINKVTFRDSLKLLPFSVSRIAQAFNLPFEKLTIDYAAPRPRGHQLTDSEIEYIKNDVRIVAAALKVMFDRGMDKMTVGANALANFRKTLSFFEFDRFFPVPVYDAEIRQSYRGGYTYLKKQYKNKELQSGIVLDVNSLYPYVMKAKPLPYGEGIHFEGQYKKNSLFNQYVQAINCQFKLKKGFLPTVQLHHSTIISSQYLENSGGEVYCLYMTNIDLELFFKHYDVYNIYYLGGWMFKSRTGIFDNYIDRWTETKQEAKREGNAPMYQIAKLMLNSLYGKMGVNPNVRSKMPVFDVDRVKLLDGPLEQRTPLYIPAASFITAWARHVTITAAQSVYDRFVYADTDSLHLIGEQLPEGLQIDPLILGAWKHEETFVKAKYIRPKCYIHFGHEPGSEQNSWHVTAAGLPHDCHDQVTWDNFKPGAKFHGKLIPRVVPGGVILESVDFTIDLS